MPDENQVSRRSLLKLIGASAGGAAMYQAMIEMGYAANSDFAGPIHLSGAPKGASVLILGAGLAGMVAAYEMQKAGYKVQILEYNGRPGGRNWSLYGGDSYTEMGGRTQKVNFAKGQYFNPGPWRIPYHHQGILHYCQMLGVKLESFVSVNNAAYIHSARAFGGKPKRYREVVADYDGHISELLAKAASQSKLDEALPKDEQDGLLQMLRRWGALDQNYEYKKGDAVSNLRGFDRPPGGGLDSMPVNSDILPRKDLFNSTMWISLYLNKSWDFQGQLFQPVGGMGMIGKTFGEKLRGLIRYNCKVTNIKQDEKGVTATYVDTHNGGAPQTAHGDFCVNTIPASVLSQIAMQGISPKLRGAVDSLSYIPGTKVGLQFKRRFWEQDDNIYGGVTYTDQPIFNIGYPSHGFFDKGPAVLLGAYAFASMASYNFEAQTAPEMIQAALDQGEKIHPQYKTEFDNGVAVAWHRVPWTLGCSGGWSDDNRAKNYDTMCAVDGRMVLAGEHCSRLPAWQEGAVLSSLDAITRLHQRALAA